MSRQEKSGELIDFRKKATNAALHDRCFRFFRKRDLENVNHTLKELRTRAAKINKRR